VAPSQRTRTIKSDQLDSLLPALRALCSLLTKSKTKGIVIGGVAASLLGQPRMTADIDATVLLDEGAIEDFLKQAGTYGLSSRITNPVVFARRSAMLLLRHEESRVPVDVAMGRLSFEREAASKAKFLNVGGISVPLPRPEDLIIMKAIAHRSQDIEDIRGILVCQPKLNVARIRKEVMALARALDMPGLWTDIAGMFKKKAAHKKADRRKSTRRR